MMELDPLLGLVLRSAVEKTKQLEEASGLSKSRPDKKRPFVPGEPCAVCGDVATGIHYSVPSCNGCKTFFRRVVIENRSYSCKQNGDCPIDIHFRCSCRHCRYKVELNVERRRKRKAIRMTEQKTTTPAMSIEQEEDTLIGELIKLEDKFLVMLTSNSAPIHSRLGDALDVDEISHSCFDDFEKHKSDQMNSNDQMNFSYWRAKILSIQLEWVKCFSAFRALFPSDQRALVVHTAFSNLVLSEAFHTPEQYTDRIVFPDGLCGFRNLTAKILRERSGLIPTVCAVVQLILVPIRRMKMTKVEYILLQAIILFDPECLALSAHGERIVRAERERLLHSLRRHLSGRMEQVEAAYRYALLLLRISNVQKVAAFKRETLCTIETFNLMSPHPLTMEISKTYHDISFF